MSLQEWRNLDTDVKGRPYEDRRDWSDAYKPRKAWDQEHLELNKEGTSPRAS